MPTTQSKQLLCIIFSDIGFQTEESSMLKIVKTLVN